MSNLYEELHFEPIPLRDKFIHAQTLDPYEGNRGVYALESACKSKAQFGLSPDALTEDFNQSSGDVQVEIRKYILTAIIPALREQSNFHGLCILVGCEDYRIQQTVIETINMLLLESDFRKLHVDIILDGLDVCLDLLNRISSDHMLTKCLSPVLITAFALLFLKSTNKEGGSAFQEKLQQSSAKYLETVDDLKTYAHENLISNDLLASLERLLNTLISRIGKRSWLQIGNWNQALCIKENRENLKTNITKMSYVEQYSCILGILNQVDLALNGEVNILLKQSIQIIFEAAVGQKLKTDTTMYSILLLTTRGLCRLLQKTRLPEGSQGIFDILEIYLNNDIYCQVRRLSLLEELDNVLCLNDKSIVTKIIYLFSRNGIQGYDIRQKVKKYIENILQLTSMKITRPRHEPPTNLKPEWCYFDATMCESRHVMLHTLLPTLNCLAQGGMEDYKLKANKIDTKIEINTLKTLRHLQETSLHPNVIRLVAYQIRPLPLFYIVDRAGDETLYSFLIQKRHDRKWLSSTELVPLVADGISAITYLHEKNVIHRDITTHSFTIVENITRRKVILTNLSNARILDSTHTSDLSDDQIPVRWSAPESILDDFYDAQSDTYMIGHLIQEIFTHGCQPYTELYNVDIEQILTWVVFHDLPPRQWPCIPKKIHEIILKCVCPEPKDRIDLKRVPELLNEFMDCDYDTRHNEFQPFDDDKLYPIINQDLSEPERILESHITT